MARSYKNMLTSAFCALVFAGTADAARISFATFNIKFYGSGGATQGTGGDEQRDQDLRTFLDTKLHDVDVIAFQEIVDVERFTSRVIGSRYRCYSYQHEHKNHQHVVICTRPSLGFRKVRNDNNFIVEELALSARYRPAVYGVVTDNKGRALIQVAAVHLKAMPEFSDVRKQQAKILADALTKSGENVPTLVTGDFNTFEDDHELIQTVFGRKQLNLSHVDFADPFTYRTQRYKNKFDRFWVTAGTRISRAPVVWRVCNDPLLADVNDWDDEGTDGPDPFADLEYYNEYISDHCPVKVELDL